MGELTLCHPKNGPRASRVWDAFQLQPPWENLHSVKPTMPKEHPGCQIHSSSRHHESTYILWNQKCHKSIKAVRIIPAPATMRELTSCQAKNAPRASRLSDSFQLQPHERTYSLLNHTYHNSMKIMRNSHTRTHFVPDMIHFVSTKLPTFRLHWLNSPPSYEGTMLQLLAACQGKWILKATMMGCQCWYVPCWCIQQVTCNVHVK